MSIGKYIIPFLILLGGSLCGESNKYLVSLKITETLDNFFKYDKTYPISQHINPLIESSFSIGKYSGFAGNFSDSALERLKRCPLVAEITPDVEVKAFDIRLQVDGPRHLGRICQKDTLHQTSPFNYCYDEGTEVLAYVIDSGINIHHPEFGGRAEAGADFTGEGPGDFNGHGTHVAGLIGSETFGSSKSVKIIEVKALNFMGSGTLSSIISSIEFCVNHRESSGLPGVANLSLGAPRNRALNRAINAAADTGLVIVVAAGNDNSDACGTSPASASRAITVGAIDDIDDSLSIFTNWGGCVDIFSSGVEVDSIDYASAGPSKKSGTSMASPIVAGLAANLLSLGNPPDNIQELIKSMSSKNRISFKSSITRFGTPNKIAYNRLEGACEEYI
ncbi:subtilase-type proteinase Rrt12p [[Candida] railenensis]|uniref:Subtilase-type proteinase Rrt12p n=1 Tax=[Candida] railenensis TaxID=45579 RepID=A0A9P0VW68_9ASCO|nr:subtilase-type proteinase Rrt12p [[Candida] railenensis]